MHKAVIFTIKFIISFCTKYEEITKISESTPNKHLCLDCVLRAR